MKRNLFFLRSICILGFFIGGFFTTTAQVVIVEDASIKTAFTQWKASNKDPNRTVPGWRIQIASSTNRRQVEDAKLSFESQYPRIPAMVNFSNPYYMLRVGAYFSKAEADRALAEYKKQYIQAYIAFDKNIKAKEILGIR